MASGGSSNKGNPASHRMGNAKRKERRARCWERGQKRKKARREAEEQAHLRNVKLQKEGRLTPWEYSKSTKKTAHAKTNPIFQLA